MAADEQQRPLRLGGMALQNGLMVHGPGHWAAAIRTADGTVRVAGGRKRVRGSIGPLEKVPIARGVVRMAEMLTLLPTVRRALPASRLPFERPSLIVLSAATAALQSGARRSGRISPAATEAIASTLALLPALMTLRSRRLAMYHGAEHKAIGAYETGGLAADVPKEHDRCGSHLVGPLMGASALASFAAGRLPERHQPAGRAAGSLAALGVAVEVFGWMSRNRSHPAARVLARPGHELQRWLGTKEPGADELEVARAALDRLLALEGRGPSAG
jgi:uncharacterized protein YqhQ